MADLQGCDRDGGGVIHGRRDRAKDVERVLLVTLVVGEAPGGCDEQAAIRCEAKP